MSDISGLLFFEIDIYHLIENALYAHKADLQGKFRKLRDNFQQISGNSALYFAMIFFQQFLLQ